MNKQRILDAALAQLRTELETLRRFATETRDAATHEEAKAENDKDTRGLEQSYLARGQAMRVEEVDETIKRLRFLQLPSFEDGRPIDLGALVRLLVDDEPKHVLLVPSGGGTKVESDGLQVVLVNPAAPVGRALIGKEEGDDFTLRIAGKVREHEVDRVW